MEKDRQMETRLVAPLFEKMVIAELDLKAKNKILRKHIRTIIWNNPKLLSGRKDDEP
jgi:hypothetical protein